MRFQIVQGDEQLSSHSGLALVGEMLAQLPQFHPQKIFWKYF
jgi:hypothetical protein